jgi:hypothetical protein|tara:strand:+ start:1547 stop:1930 length:384 start_codon:yes stop_codon:yes gene_type:complete
MKKDWKKEISRDVLAFGSIVFYVLVVVRALIKPYRPFVDSLVVAILVLILLSIFIKNYDSYIARGFILAFFTSVFYQDKLFTIFASFLFFGLIFSSYYIGTEKSKILKGLIFGAISIAIGYYGVFWV